MYKLYYIYVIMMALSVDHPQDGTIRAFTACSDGFLQLQAGCLAGGFCPPWGGFMMFMAVGKAQEFYTHDVQ